LAEQAILRRRAGIQRAGRLQQRRQKGADQLDEEIAGAGVWRDEGGDLPAEVLARLKRPEIAPPTIAGVS
jgi:hypothetical protein